MYKMKIALGTLLKYVFYRDTIFFFFFAITTSKVSTLKIVLWQKKLSAMSWPDFWPMLEWRIVSHGNKADECWPSLHSLHTHHDYSNEHYSKYIVHPRAADVVQNTERHNLQGIQRPKSCLSDKKKIAPF